jgi:arginyl-tRNA synthetase
VTAFRLNLSNETGKVIQSAMLLLGIELPDRM